MANLLYARFIIDLAMKAIDGDEYAINFLKKKEFRIGVESFLSNIEAEIEIKRNLEEIEDSVCFIVEATSDAKDDTLKLLRKWLKGENQIDIVDPYLMSKVKGWDAKDIDKFAEDVCSIFPHGATVNIFINGYCTDMRKAIWKKIKEGRTARLIQTEAFHDRFILTDGKAKLMGASFNGLGRKISSLIDLDEDDTQAIRKSIHKERLVGTKIAGPSF